MRLHLPDSFRAARANADAGRDPAFDDLGDSFWLGGEALVAPACASALRDARRLAADECADPNWLAI
jgi:hypothetical protein